MVLVRVIILVTAGVRLELSPKIAHPSPRPCTDGNDGGDAEDHMARPLAQNPGSQTTESLSEAPHSLTRRQTSNKSAVYQSKFLSCLPAIGHGIARHWLFEPSALLTQSPDLVVPTEACVGRSRNHSRLPHGVGVGVGVGFFRCIELN